MTQAVRATRDVPYGAWFAASNRAVPCAGGAPAPSARRLAWEAGPSGLDAAPRLRLVAAPVPGRRPSLLAAAAAHALLLAAVLLAARPALPPEREPVAVPLVFEPAPAGPAVPLAPPPEAQVPEAQVPEAQAPAPPPPVPAPDVPAPDAAAAPPESVAALPPDAAPAPPLAGMAAPQPPRLRAPPALRPVPHLAPTLPRPVPSRSAANPAPPGPARPEPAPRPGVAPAAATPAPAGPTLAARPLAGAPGNIQPAYPEQARRRGVEGRVVVRATVSAAGRVVGVAVAQSSGSDALDRGATDAVRGYSFAPALRGGVAVEGVADLPFTFRLGE